MHFPRHWSDKAALDLDRAYAGGFPDLKFQCHRVTRDHIHWQPEINPHPAKALDIHHFSPAIRDLMFADAIAEFLGLIFDSKAFASQTLGFLRGSAQEGHHGFCLCALHHPAPVRRHLVGAGRPDDWRRRTVLLPRQPSLRRLHLQGPLQER